MKMSKTEPVSNESARILEEHHEFLFPCLKPYYREPLVLAEGSGTWVTDVEGNRYLDFFSGILTTSVGHCHPRVVERVSRQLGQLGHTSTLYVNEKQVQAARTLAGISPGELKTCFFTNSGTEAVETATGCSKGCTQAQTRAGHEKMKIKRSDSIRPTTAGGEATPGVTIL